MISTPVSIVSGLTAASAAALCCHPGPAGGVYLEEGRNLKWLALDKTGTLTHGKPVQTDLQDWEVSDSSRQPAALVAASLAARSDHPACLPWPLAARDAGARLCSTWHDSPPCPARRSARDDGVAFQLGATSA